MSYPPDGIGRGAYVDACKLLGQDPDLSLSPVARVGRLPAWYTPELVATEPARAKLKAWAAITPVPWTTPVADDIVLRMAAFGDFELVSLASEVIAGLPPCVASYAVARVTYTAIGRQLHGSCGPRPDFGDRPFWISLSASSGTESSIRSVVAEEIAHAWLLAEPALDVHAPTAFVWHAQASAPVPAGLETLAYSAVEAYRREDLRQERLAADLIRAWGFER